MVHPRKRADLLLHGLELRQSDRRLSELPLVDALPHDAVDHLANLLRRRIVQHPHRRFDTIRQHDDGGLNTTRRRTRVRELRGVGRHAVTLLRLLEEVCDRPRAVVLADELHDTTRKLVLLGEIQPFEHVIPDDRGARRGLELVVRVATLRLVLGEVLRFLQLADVVVEAPTRARRPFAPMALLALSARFAIAMVCA